MAEAKDENANIELAVQPPVEDIKNLILTIRGKQVLLDSDVARLYGYETKTINQAASRNKERFPPEFRFQLTNEEVDEVLRSQFVTLKNDAESLVAYNENAAKQAQGKHRKYRPYAYSEQGIGMLSGTLKNKTAVQVSIGIMNAFVEMRQFISANRDVFANIANINLRLLEHDGKFIEQGEKIDEIIDLLSAPETIKQSIFYKGQFYDAFNLIAEIIKSAKKQIIVVDNYADDSVVEILSKKNRGAVIVIITSNPSKLSKQCLDAFGKQYGPIQVVKSNDFHDRFVVVDDKEVYAVGASLKDLGNKCFEISKNEDTGRFVAYVNGIINS